MAGAALFISDGHLQHRRGGTSHSARAVAGCDGEGPFHRHTAPSLERRALNDPPRIEAGLRSYHSM